MTISVVIPTYNGELFIEKTINSILNQTRQPDEIIISDDNSSDRTIDLCQKYSDKVKIFKNQDGPSGFVNGWNNAIAYATCEFISILHQDDLLAPTFLEEVEKAHEFHPDVKHIVSTCNYIDGEGNLKRESSHNSGEIKRYTGQEYSDIYILKGYDHINRCPGVVTHRDIFKVCSYRPEAGHIADDDFFIRVGNYTDIVCIHKPLAFYREHSSSETGHLDLLTLNLRLLNDYYYQISECDNNPILSYEAKLQFRKNEAQFGRRMLFYSLRYRKFKYFIKTLKHIGKSSMRDKGINLFFFLKIN